MLRQGSYSFCGLLDDHDGLNSDDELLAASMARLITCWLKF